jgi:hypothetical protein
MTAPWDPILYAGLQAIAATSFPKTCHTCGRVYRDADEYFSATLPVGLESSGLKQALDDGHPIVELYRNCACGSTLMDFFGDRRDVSPAGLLRRQRFGELIAYLGCHGVEAALARGELIKVMRGGQSEVLRRVRPPGK